MSGGMALHRVCIRENNHFLLKMHDVTQYSLHKIALFHSTGQDTVHRKKIKPYWVGHTVH